MRTLLLLSLVATSGSFVLPPLPPPTQPQQPTSRLDAYDIGELPDHLDHLAIAATSSVVANVVELLIWNGTYPELDDNDLDLDFREILSFGAVDSIIISARVYLGLALGSLALDRLSLPFPTPFEAGLQEPTAIAVAFTVWLALTACTFKRVVLLQLVSGTKLGRVSLYDRLFDFVIALATTAVLLNEVGVDIGAGIKSFFAAGGIGALLFSLASRGLAENIVGGVVLQAYDAFEEGDNIRLGDGTEGIVESIGLSETEIVGYDNVQVKIPNKEFIQRVSNLSRVKQSQVEQTLRFKYSDLESLEDVMECIKQEIQKSCPDLIADGSKPFRAVLKSFQADHVKASVNCHFNISPGSAAYAETQQQVILAIARALRAKNIEFALPASSVVYKTNKGQTAE